MIIREDVVKDKLSGFTVRFIDDWDEYHCYYGEIHCGTNVKRTPSGINWWE
jgi:protein-arginine deiminase